MRGSTIVLEGEDPSEFEDLVLELKSSLRPVGRMEGALAERIAGCHWRLERVLAMERDVLTELGCRADGEEASRIHNLVNLYGTLSPRQPWQDRGGKEELSALYDTVRARDFELGTTPTGAGPGRG